MHIEHQFRSHLITCYVLIRILLGFLRTVVAIAPPMWGYCFRRDEGQMVGIRILSRGSRLERASTTAFGTLRLYTCNYSPTYGSYRCESDISSTPVYTWYVISDRRGMFVDLPDKAWIRMWSHLQTSALQLPCWTMTAWPRVSMNSGAPSWWNQVLPYTPCIITLVLIMLFYFQVRVTVFLWQTRRIGARKAIHAFGMRML